MTEPRTYPKELPKYRCHKVVHAVKIWLVNPSPDPAEGGAMIVPTNSMYEPIFVDHAYMLKHAPEPGGYYVVYADGYRSYSPGRAFEEGYTLIE